MDQAEEQGKERRFPVMIRPGEERVLEIVGCPLTVPWAMLAEHEAQARANHGQTLERLAARMGLSTQEILAIIHDAGIREYLRLDTREASELLAKCVREWENIRELEAKVAKGVREWEETEIAKLHEKHIHETEAKLDAQKMGFDIDAADIVIKPLSEDVHVLGTFFEDGTFIPSDDVKPLPTGSVNVLPDGSVSFTASMPLPEDHWIYEPKTAPPRGLRCGTDNELRKTLEEHIAAAAKYAISGATMNGKEMDFDPDALVQDMIVGLLGYYTDNGRTDDEGHIEGLPDQVTSIERSDDSW